MSKRRIPTSATSSVGLLHCRVMARRSPVGARHEDSASTTINSGQTNGSATDAGAVYVFSRRHGVESTSVYQVIRHGAGQAFGRSVALSGDGSLLVVGAPGDMANQGAVFVFARAGTAGVKSRR